MKNKQFSMQDIMVYALLNDWCTRAQLLELAKAHGCDAKSGTIPRKNKHGEIKRYQQRGGSVTTRCLEAVDILNEKAGGIIWKLVERVSNTPAFRKGKPTKKFLKEYKIQLIRPTTGWKQ